ARIVDEIGDPFPNPHRADRERDFGDVAGELADAAGINAGGMAAGIVLFNQHRFEPGKTEMQRGGAAVNAATHDDGVGYSGHPRPPASAPAPVSGRPASSDSIIGFPGARSL